LENVTLDRITELLYRVNDAKYSDYDWKMFQVEAKDIALNQAKRIIYES